MPLLKSVLCLRKAVQNTVEKFSDEGRSKVADDETEVPEVAETSKTTSVLKVSTRW
jgi:hypothetical protein